MKLNKKGFTLVELLAVIVVLSLLMVVAASSIGGALDNSKKSALKTEAQKVLTSAAQDAITENMLDNTQVNGTTPKKIYGTEGDYMWYLETTVSGGEATVTGYCVLYSPETNTSTNTSKGAYSLYGTNIKSFSNLGTPVDKDEVGSCTITKDPEAGTYTITKVESKTP